MSIIRSPTLAGKGLEMNKIDKIVLASQKLSKPHSNAIEILLSFMEETISSLGVEEMTIFGISPWFSEMYLAPFRKSKGNNIKDVLLDGRWIQAIALGPDKFMNPLFKSEDDFKFGLRDKRIMIMPLISTSPLHSQA